MLHAQVDLPRRCSTQRFLTAEPSADTGKLKRKSIGSANRVCNQTLPKIKKGPNEWVVYGLCFVAIVCSLVITAFCSQQPPRQTTSTLTLPPAQTPIAASGQWQMEMVSDQETTYSVAFIKQDNATICGLGQDPLGSYSLEGKLWSERLWFVKRYDEQSCISGAPRQDIIFDGVLSNPTGSMPVAKGKYETQIKTGFPTSYFKKTEWKTVRGRWTATMIGALPTQMSMHLENRARSWNPLKDLDVQPANSTSQPAINVSQDGDKQGKLVEAVFYSILAAAIIGAAGWIMYLSYRLLERNRSQL